MQIAKVHERGKQVPCKLYYFVCSVDVRSPKISRGVRY